jgi:ParB family chromosome partitioning protein
LLEIEMAHWWRPTAANFFDRVPKARIQEAFDAVGGPELVSRYAGSKKADLATAAERIFSGEFIGEADVKEQALAWVPAVMRFDAPKEEEIHFNRAAGESEHAIDEVTEEAA